MTSLLLALHLLQAVPPHVALGRICWSEAGIDSRESCAALHTALRARARHRGIPWTRHARGYSRSVFRLDRAQPARPWLVDLHAHGRRPRGWYGHLGWGPYRSRWFQLLEHTRGLVRKPRNPCTDPATGEALSHGTGAWPQRSNATGGFSPSPGWCPVRATGGRGGVAIFSSGPVDRVYGRTHTRWAGGNEYDSHPPKPGPYQVQA